MNFRFLSLAWALGLALPLSAETPRPASVLVFPVHHSSTTAFTAISVTNSNTNSFGGGGTRALFRYVLAEPTAEGPLKPECGELYRSEHLTPADTVTVLTACHVGQSEARGYLVVSAKDPSTGVSWSHNHLVGSQLVINFGSGGFYSLTPIPLRAIADQGSPTEVDMDGRLDFDGIEYEQLPDDLQLDAFLGVGDPRLTLINFSGDQSAVVSVHFAVFNDNEFPLSTQFSFRCWFSEPLSSLSGVFSQAYLLNNTPNDPGEVDINCDGINDLESGWARISATSANGNFGSTSNPPLLGALVGGPGSIEGGRPLWGSISLSNGEF